MAEPILDVNYWRLRLNGAQQLHHAIFRCPLDKWLRIEAKHRQILAATVGDLHSVFDAGCGWGRLLTLMPPTWRGLYVGADLSPNFVALAKEKHPDRSFMVADLRRLPLVPVKLFDWAVLISMRPMIRRNLGDDVWQLIEANLRAVCAKLLYLEYDEDDEGSVE